jgi:hypothetical protein
VPDEILAVLATTTTGPVGLPNREFCVKQRFFHAMILSQYLC